MLISIFISIGILIGVPGIWGQSNCIVMMRFLGSEPESMVLPLGMTLV